MDSTLNKPYDLFAAIDRLRNDADSLPADVKNRLKSQIALNAADPRAVSLLVDIDGDNWASIYPPVAPDEPISTNRAIDTFLNRYGHSSPAEDALLEKLIFNPVPEYSATLAEGDNTPDDQTDDAAALARMAAQINGKNTPQPDVDEQPDAPVTVTQLPATPQTPAPATKRPAQPPLSLELAKIFVKQGQFDRAHEIISKIILNNPEKSVYFADQLRFLEKLIKIKQAQALKSAR